MQSQLQSDEMSLVSDESDKTSLVSDDDSALKQHYPALALALTRPFISSVSKGVSPAESPALCTVTHRLVMRSGVWCVKKNPE